MSLPIYWTWAEPLGAAASHPRVKQLIRINVLSNLGSPRTPEQVADLVDAEITSRGLTDSADVGILLQRWGEDVTGSRLWRHPDDQVSSVDAPFFENGVAECRSWVRDFIAQYVSNGTVDPYAFWMDTESRITTTNGLYAAWSDIKADPRWGTEFVTPDDETWAVLDPADPDGSLGDATSFPWIRDVRVGLFRSQAYAMHRGFFSLVREQWPNVLGSNWRTSHDGLDLDSPATENNVYYRTFGATHQAPVLYGNPSSQYQELFGETGTRATRAQWEYPQKVKQNQLSWQQRPFSPWILSYGEGGDLTGGLASGYYSAVIQNGVLDQIDHYLVWSNTGSTEYLSAANWNSFVAEFESAEANGTAILKALGRREDVSNKAPQTYIKHPDEVRQATMSFRHKISRGDSLTGTPVVVASPSGPTISNVAITTSAAAGDYINASSGEAVRFTISGGTDGTAYRLTVAANTVGGETLVGLADITVEDEA